VVEITQARARRAAKTRVEAVAEDIRRQIEAHELKPGEQLASYKDLGSRYAVGQGTINAAIQKLARQGLIVTKRRAGAFVSTSLDATPDRPATAQSAPATSTGLDADYYFRPLEQSRPKLKLYLSELLPETIETWNRLMGECELGDQGPGIGLHTCADGHLQRLIPQASFDVIETTPWVLQSIDRHRNAKLSVDSIGRRPDEFIGLAQDWITDRPNTAGVPFMATLSYLFVNLDLLEQVGMKAKPPRGGAELLRMAGEADRRLTSLPSRPRGMDLSALHDVLILEGACRWENDRLVVSKRRLRQCAEALVEQELPTPDTNTTSDRFISGQTALLHHCSFLTVQLKREANFRWAMLPLIQPQGLPIPAKLTLLSIDPKCYSPLDALTLTRYLLSDSVQASIAQIHGRVPVIRSAAFADDVCRSHPAGAAYQQMLESSSCVWPEEVVYRLARCMPVEHLMRNANGQPQAIADAVIDSLTVGFGTDVELDPDSNSQ